MMNSAYIFNTQRLVPAIMTQDSLAIYLRKNPEAYVISRKQYQEEIQSAGDMIPVFEQQDTFEKPLSVIYELRR